MNEYKVCSTCGFELPVQKFPFKYGEFQDECASCQSKMRRRARQEEYEQAQKEQEDRMWEEYYFYTD